MYFCRAKIKFKYLPLLIRYVDRESVSVSENSSLFFPNCPRTLHSKQREKGVGWAGSLKHDDSIQICPDIIICTFGTSRKTNEIEILWDWKTGIGSQHGRSLSCTSKPSFQSSSIGCIEPPIVYSSTNFSLFPVASWYLQNGRTSKGWNCCGETRYAWTTPYGEPGTYSVRAPNFFYDI